MFCPKCGKQILEIAKFCNGCGNPIPSFSEEPIGTQDSFAKLPEQMKSSNQEKLPEQKEEQDQQIPVTPQDIQFVEDIDRMSAPTSNSTSDIAMDRYVRDEECKNRKLTIILYIILVMLILMVAGIAGCYVMIIKNRDISANNRIEESKNVEGVMQTKEVSETEEEEQEQNADQGAEPNEFAEDEGVVSETNEVVRDIILENIPKAAYSYSFNDTLGNARAVIRNEPETDPEETDDIQPQYMRGIDEKAVYLDGTYGIKLSDVESVGDSYTIAFWMKADQLCDWSPFIHIGQNLTDPTKRVRLWLGQKTDTASIAPIISSERVQTESSYEIRPGDAMPNTIEAGVWYHIAFTVDGLRQGSKQGRLLGTLYVDGNYVAEGDVVPDMMNVEDFSVYLGINNWDEMYPVAFDEVKIWNQVLDEGQIEELYSAY